MARKGTEWPADAIPPGEAGRLLGVSAQTIRGWIEAGRLRGWWLGGQRRVSRAEVLSMPRAIIPRRPPGTQAEKEHADLQRRQRILERRSARIKSA